MWPSSRANRPGLGTVLLALGLSAAVARGAGFAPAPEDDGAHYRRCLAAARSAPAEAFAAAEDWRSAGGGFPAAHCAAVALFGLQRYDEAARQFDALAGALMARGPDIRAGALEQAGQAWLLAGKPQAARAAFDAALRFTPDDPDLLIDRARAEGAQNAFRDAVADLDAALALDPKRADALIYRASSWRQLGVLDRARADAEQALALAPEDPDGHLERGNIRRLQGDANGAGEDWRRAERLAPGSPAAAAASRNLAALAAQPR